MIQKYTFRFYPTVRQERALMREFGCVRYAYNWALRLRTDSFKLGKLINYNTSSAAWTAHKKDPQFAWLNDCSSVPQQQALRNLQADFSDFFGGNAVYPKFRSKRGAQSAEYTSAAFQWHPQTQNLLLPKIGRLRITWSYKITRIPTTIIVTKDDCGRYFVSFCLALPIRQASPKTGRAIGLNLGVCRLATLSDGTRIPNPPYTAYYTSKLDKAQKQLARKKTGSGRWQVLEQRVMRIRSRITNSRNDALQKLTTDLVSKFDVIAIEDHPPQEDFRKMLSYKAVLAGREVRIASCGFPSSTRCSYCGYIHPELPHGVIEFTCLKCGEHLDRDGNKSKNILKFAKLSSPTTAGRAGRQARSGHAIRRAAPAKLRNVHRSVNQPGSVL